MRRNRLFSVAMSTVLATAAFGTAPAVAQEPVTLDLWNFGAMGLEELISQYETEHNIKVNIVQRGYDEHHEALLTALMAGEVPDIAAVEVGYNSLFKANPQVFTDLRDFGAEALAPEYLDWRWAQGVATDGTIIGLPTDVGGIAMCYRTDLFEAAGLPTDPDAVSALWPDWDAFVETGKTFMAAGTGAKFIDSAGGTVYNLVKNQGTEKYYAPNDPNTLIYDTNPQNLKAWSTAVAAIEAGLSANISQFSPEWNAGMANGDFAVLGCPAWMMNYIQGQAPDTSGKWNIASAPDKGGNWGGSQLTVPKASDHAQEAYDLIQWLLTPENQLAVFKMHGNFPSTPALYDTPEVQDFTNPFFSDAPVGKIFAESAKALSPIYEGPRERAIDREFGNGLGRIEAGLETPDEAWTSTLANIQLALQD